MGQDAAAMPAPRAPERGIYVQHFETRGPASPCASTNRGLAPVVVFIPQNRLDTASVSDFVDANAMLLDPNLVLADVGTAEIAWERFNLEEPGSNDICHPTPYGYREIAEHVAGVLRQAGLVRRGPSR